LPVNQQSAQRAVDVLRRLPKEVEYTRIKMIFFDLPSSISTLTWQSAESGDALLTAFARKTARAVERQLRRLERAIPTMDPSAADRERERVRMVRNELVQLCFQEVNRSRAQGPVRSIEVALVTPDNFRPECRPPGPDTPHTRIRVFERPRSKARRRRGPKVLAERFFMATAAPSGDATIPWQDSDGIDRVTMELLLRFFPQVMSVRCGQRWRSKYPAVGWPLITQFVVPLLFEELRPYYPVRHYRDHRQAAPAGYYSAQLLRDITDIIRLELPYLAQALTVGRVTAAVQRHVQHPRHQQQRATEKRPKQ